MHNINEITTDQIGSLDETQLGKLLELLLNLEANDFSLPQAIISVPENEKSKDGGIDGHISWVPGVNKTKNLGKSPTGFQNKATNMGPNECKEEILVPLKKGDTIRKLKPEVKKLADANGSYVLFTTQALNPSLIQSRISKIREGFKDAGHPKHATLDIQVYDANYIRVWTNRYLSTVNMVQTFRGITKPHAFSDWNKLKGRIKADRVPYKEDNTLSGHIQDIHHQISQSQTLRINGHSGLGKTRMILEAFRPTNQLTRELNAQFIYIDLSVEGNYQSLYNYINSHHNTQYGIIVADNCDADKHSILSTLLSSQESLKLITIGFDDNKSITDPKIKLERKDQKTLVRDIIQQQLGVGYPVQHVEYLARLCEGYPWMAVRYCEVILKSNITDFDRFFEKNAIERLVFGSKQIDKNAYAVLRACAVFSAFGFVDDSFASVINENYRTSLQVQMDFIRTRVSDPVVSDTEFREILINFKNEDIIEQRGTYYIVKPTVLAIQLAAEWLTVTSLTKIEEIIEELRDKKLETKFAERLTDLDQLDKAKDIVEELWGAGSSFGSAEVLNTAWGSLLFRYVVEVNPEATCAALIAAFGDWSQEQLLEITEGRRNIIWALEKLSFRESTFIDAAQLLFKLAISENENWANNASGQITQLFQRFLAGTEADYDKRIEIIDWALAQKNDEYTRLAISCMSRSFIPQGHHHRSGGAEEQGGGAPLVDFMPKTWDEIYAYWQKVIYRLLPIINAHGINSEQALNALARGVRTLFSEGAADMMMASLSAVENRSGEAWMNVRAELKKTLRYEQVHLGIHEGAIKEFLSESQPQTLAEQLLAYVSLPEWSYEPPIKRGGSSIYKQQEDAENFAEQLVKDGTDWTNYIPTMIVGEQRQIFVFGKVVGQNDPKAKALVEIVIAEMQQQDRKTVNIGLLLGLISGINEPLYYEELMQRFLAERDLSWLALHLTRHYDYALSTLMQLFRLVDDYGEHITVFDHFRYGSRLTYLNASEIEQFIDRIASYGSDGIITAFSVLFMQCFQNQENWEHYGKKLRSLMMSTNLTLSRLSNMEPFYWSETATKLLNHTYDKDLATTLSQQLAEFSDDKNFSYRFDHEATSVFEILFNQYFKEAWPAISEALGSNYLTVMHLKNMIGVKNGNDARIGVLFESPENYDTILDWAKQNEKGRILLANILPFSQQVVTEDAETGQKTNEVQIHSFAKKFLDLFGHEEKVLDELAANVGTFGTVGGSEWYFQQLADLFRQLFSHPKPKVKAWGKSGEKYYLKMLKVEGLENENRSIE